MLRPIVRTGVTLFVLAYFLPSITFTNWVALLITAIVLSLFNAILKPVLKILLLPINVVTLGLFSAVINAFILWLVTYLVPGFKIDNLVIGGMVFNQFFTYILVSAGIALLQSLVRVLL